MCASPFTPSVKVRAHHYLPPHYLGDYLICIIDEMTENSILDFIV